MCVRRRRDTTPRSGLVPVTPEQIAESAIGAARAGAAVVHVHVVTPTTRQGSRDVSLYHQAVEIIRDADVDAVINLTAGMGGDLVLGGPQSPLPFADDGTDMVGASERLAHVAELRPEICAWTRHDELRRRRDYVMTNTPDMLRTMAAEIRALGVRPELEVFDKASWS